MMTRGYAERLVANHIPEENVLNTDLLDHSEVFPCIENMLYVGARPFEYTIPLFVENVNFKSTFYIVRGTGTKEKGMPGEFRPRSFLREIFK